MSERDDLFARPEVNLDLLDALIQELRVRLGLDRRLPDVPLHQRGFGVMADPPA